MVASRSGPTEIRETGARLNSAISLHVSLRLGRQIGETAGGGGWSAPAGHFFVNRLALVEYLRVGGEFLQHLVATAIANAQLEVLTLVEYVESGQGDAGQAVDAR